MPQNVVDLFNRPLAEGVSVGEALIGFIVVLAIVSIWNTIYRARLHR